MVLGRGLLERSQMFLTHLTSSLFSLFLIVDKCAFDYCPQLLILREFDDTDVLGVITSPLLVTVVILIAIHAQLFATYRQFC